jgi:hypothetical protein
VVVSRIVIEGSNENRKKRMKKMKKIQRNSFDTLLEMEEMLKTWRKIE